MKRIQSNLGKKVSILRYYKKYAGKTIGSVPGS